MEPTQLSDAGRPAVALIAHDARKTDMIKIVRAHHATLANERLIATGTTGRLIREHAELVVECAASGPLGGDLQIGAQIASGGVKLVVFLRDPLNAHAHEPDIQALFKICDTQRVPLATNTATAELCLAALAEAAAA
jgi:methylglyoxal synthase